MIDLASDLNIVEKSGAWYSDQGERIGQGRENAKAYLEQHPDLMDKIEGLILQKHGIKPRTASAAVPMTEGNAVPKDGARANGSRPDEGKKVPHVPVKTAN